ncbi:MAG: hypothetical protein U1F30_02480 [Steroidobacteraceae bacterium]
MHRHRPIVLAAATALIALASAGARSAVAVGIDAGTLGIGPEVQLALTHSLNLRLGVAAFSYSRNVTDTDVTYDGTLKLANGFGMLEWHPGGSIFKLAIGAVGTANKVDVDGVPTGGSYQLGDNTYPASDIGTVTGKLKVGSGIAPYVGIGVGNPLADGSHFKVQFDVGVMYTGAPKAEIVATCAAAVPAPTCAQIQADVLVEINKLEQQSTQLKVWPVINLGVAYRF